MTISIFGHPVFLYIDVYHIYMAAKQCRIYARFWLYPCYYLVSIEVMFTYDKDDIV